MKKLFALLSLLFIGGAVLTPAWAADEDYEDYDLFICGQKVTSDNASKITFPGITGTVSYNNSTKTLTLTNASIETSEICIRNMIEGLKIVINGNATINSTSNHAIVCRAKTTILSEKFSSLTIKAEKACALYATDGSTLRIENIWLNVSGSYAVTGDSTEEMLELSCCNIYARTTDSSHSCVCDFKDIYTWGVVFNYDGSKYDKANQCMVNKSGDILTTHTLSPRIAISKYIWNVSKNQTIDSSSPGSGITSGSFTYDSSTHTLTMNNVSMNSGSYAGVRYYGLDSDLTIKVTGNNTIVTTAGSEGIFSYGRNLTISGDSPETSMLTIDNSSWYGISIRGEKTLTIEDIDLNIKGTSRWSMYGYNTAGLVFKNSMVKAAHGISYFKSCTFNNCYANNYFFSEKLGGFTNDNTSVMSGLLTIEQGYGLWVANKPVTIENKDDILGNGKVRFWPDNNILALYGVTINSGDDIGIENYGIEGLNICVIGNSTINSNAGGIYSKKDFTIYSNDFSTLFVNGGEGNMTGIYAGGGSKLLIQTIWLNVTGGYPLTGSTYNALQLDRCRVSAKSKGSIKHTCITDFKEINTYSTIYEYNDITYDTEYLELVSSNGSTITEHEVYPRAAVKKFMFNPNSNVTIDKDTPGAGVTEGTINYSNYTMTLNNVTIDTESYKAIGWYGPQSGHALTVKLNGTNTINCQPSSGNPGIYSWNNDLNIVGNKLDNDKLDINNSKSYGIDIEGNNTLAIDKASVSVNGESSRSLYGHDKAKLNISDSYVKAAYGIGGFTDCKMNRCGIALPKDAWFSPTVKGITLDGSSVYKGLVEIEDAFCGLYIGETAVMTSNADDILGDGQFSYDTGTKTLTVKNANLENYGVQGGAIDSRDVDGLIINIEGENTITSRNSPIYSRLPFTITGTGSLEATSTKSGGLRFGNQCTECTIDGPTLIFKGAYGAIEDYGGVAELTIKGENTHITLIPGNGNAAIVNLYGLKMSDGQHISEPAGVKFSPELKSVTLDGEKVYRGQIIISGYDPCDVNRDCTVDVADIATVIDVMAGRASEYVQYADVNNDNAIDVADIGTIIDYMAAHARKQQTIIEED